MSYSILYYCILFYFILFLQFHEGTTIKLIYIYIVFLNVVFFLFEDSEDDLI